MNTKKGSYIRKISRSLLNCMTIESIDCRFGITEINILMMGFIGHQCQLIGTLALFYSHGNGNSTTQDESLFTIVFLYINLYI